MRIILVVAILFSCSPALPSRSRPERYTASPATVRVSRQAALDNFNDAKDLLVAQAAVSNRCVTPHLTCLLAQSVPVGTTCWCATPNGPVTGTVQ